VHPIAFQIGSLTIHWYGVMVALAFIAGIWTATRRCPRDGLRPEAIADLGPWLIVGGLLGARALYVITYWKESFADRPWWEVLMIHHGGLVFYGGLIGAVLAAVVYVKCKRLPPMKVADALAPSIALGHVFGRIGCLLNGCCYGSACTLPWAIHFPAEHETGGQGVHPTQLYEAGLNLILFVALEKLYRRKRFDGQVFGLYLIAYAVLRAVVELFRGDYGTHRVGPFTPGQLVSAVILVAGAALLWIQHRASKGKAAA